MDVKLLSDQELEDQLNILYSAKKSLMKIVEEYNTDILGIKIEKEIRKQYQQRELNIHNVISK